MRYGFAFIGAVALAGGLAQGAELPSRQPKNAVVQKNETCEIGGQPGFRLPGGDTCMRIGGYVSAGVTGTSSKTH
jgi:hypothetical protein